MLRFKLHLTSINELSGNGNSYNANGSTIYTVEGDGTVKLPIIGRVSVNGFNIRDCETMLEDKYS